jgi:ABC-type nitrate/sulfonate/bicarbonate transport system substrate-binding protein
MLRTLLFLLAASIGVARADPVTIHFGYSTSAEEQLWLLLAKPDLGPNNGKAYTLDATRFSGSDKRAQAYEAGALDLATFSGSGILLAAAAGIDAKIIASICRESQRGAFTTSFMALTSSPIKTISDLKGHTIAPNGFSTAGELWIKAALERNGLTESDVTLVPVSFPAMLETLKSGKIDVGEMPQPFAAIAQQAGLVKTIFTAKDAVPFDEELLVVAAKPAFLQAQPTAVRAFLADLRTATHFYLEHTAEARQILIDKKFVRVSPEIYLGMKDYYREPDLRIDTAAMKEMQALEVKDGFQSKAVDIDKLVDMTFLN